jgi:branched-chain amino acid transport system substrate-binding protein
MPARAGLAVIVVAVVWLGAGCGGTKPEAFRIGILTDCFGPFSTLYETSVASAELPLLGRGGRLAGKQPSSGVAGAEVAGRPAELEIGCVSGNDDVIPVARRLVEERGAQAIVGPLDPQEGMILREYARRQPTTAFLIQPSGAPELTLTEPAPNVFRFAPDAAQSVAGAGSYAYRELGWRTAAIVADDIPYSWEGAAGFISEFCSLGGRIVDRAWIPVGADPAAVVPHLPPATDGVYLGLALSPALGFLKRYSVAHHPVSQRLVSTTALLYDPRVVPLTRGVVVAGNLPVQSTAATAGYATSFAKAFPAMSAATAIDPTTVPYRDGVEALLAALDRNGGKTGAPLLAALARLELASPMGRVHLDANRQAVGPNYLSRIAVDAKGKPAIRTVRVVPNVEQRFGGYFAPGDPPPNRTHPACVKRTPPPWAR